MADLLAGLGLDDLKDVDIFEDATKKQEENQEVLAPVVQEKDLIYDKSFVCPVCGEKFTNKIMKTGKARMLGMDKDLRPIHEGVDTQKYDVIMCPECKYAALSRYFPYVTSMQAKLIREHITAKVKVHQFNDATYTYPEAIERYKLALANAVVKHARNSEKAYISLKSAWMFRGYAKQLEDDPTAESGEPESMYEMEEAHLQNAYKGFTEAIKAEGFPMCGMDEVTIDYLLAVLALHCKEYDHSGKLVSKILTSANATSRIKDKARDLKEEILQEMKKNK